jgi:hypothetical protein
MSLGSQSTNQSFPFAYDKVFDALSAAIPACGMKLKSADRVIGRITGSSGMSFFSYGENVTLVVERVDNSNTRVSMESSLKVGINVAGAHRHSKNFDRVIAAASARLQADMRTDAAAHPGL